MSYHISIAAFDTPHGAEITVRVNTAIFTIISNCNQSQVFKIADEVGCARYLTHHLTDSLEMCDSVIVEGPDELFLLLFGLCANRRARQAA